MKYHHRLVFMGSPDFAVPVLEALTKEFLVAGVVTQPDRLAGRGGKLRQPPVKEAAIRAGLPVIQPEKVRLPEAMQQLQAWRPDVIVVAAFGQILKQDLLDLPPFGCINVHASLLPWGRGAAPIQAAILEGLTQTGISIMKMDAGVDTGPILKQEAIPIFPDDTGGALTLRLANLGAELLPATLEGYLSDRIHPKPQPQEGITYASLLKKEDGKLDLTESAASLEKRVRALQPWPGAYIEMKDGPLKILHCRVIDQEKPVSGSRLTRDGFPALRTGAGVLVLEEVQPAGRKVMSGSDYLRGHKDWLEETDESSRNE